MLKGDWIITLAHLRTIKDESCFQVTNTYIPLLNKYFQNKITRILPKSTMEWEPWSRICMKWVELLKLAPSSDIIGLTDGESET